MLNLENQILESWKTKF